MATAIPSPLPISCTDCNQPMRVEFQLDLIVAAECRCGRIIGEIPTRAVLMLGRGQPLTRADIQVRADVDLGKEAVECIARARAAIADMERLVAAATWQRDGRAPSTLTAAGRTGR